MTQEQTLKVLNSGKNTFITGRAGTGKSHVIDLFKKQNSHKIIHIAAPTGMAAINVGGKTLHSLFKLPFNKFDFQIWKEKSNRWLREDLMRIKILIIDEISMVSSEILSNINLILKWVNQSTKPFGGIQIIVVGDFFQLECIISREVDFMINVKKPIGEGKETIHQNDNYRLIRDGLKYSLIPLFGWDYPKPFSFDAKPFSETVRTHELKPSKRFNPTNESLTFLSDEVDVTVQTVKDKERYKLAFYSPSWREADFITCYLDKIYRQQEGDELLTVLNKIRLGEVDEEVYSLLSKCQTNKQSNPTRLFTKNIKVDKINLKNLEELKEQPFTYKADFKGDEREVEKHFKNSNFEKLLTLKKNARVMFIVNDPDKQYVNGTTGIITDINDIELTVQTDSDKIIYVRKVTQDIKDNETDALISSISQIPLKTAWAITIHKSQGMTLESVSIDLSDAFVTGQGYVALSRCKTLEKIHLVGVNMMALQVNPIVKKADPMMQRASRDFEKELKCLN